MSYSAEYQNLICDIDGNKDEVLERVSRTVQSNIGNLSCIADKICSLDHQSVTNCGRIQKRDTYEEYTGFNIVISCDPRKRKHRNGYDSLALPFLIRNNNSREISRESGIYVVTMRIA